MTLMLELIKTQKLSKNWTPELVKLKNFLKKYMTEAQEACQEHLIESKRCRILTSRFKLKEMNLLGFNH
jgi:recombinational DNA repair protein (RecF pathway)